MLLAYHLVSMSVSSFTRVVNKYTHTHTHTHACARTDVHGRHIYSLIDIHTQTDRWLKSERERERETDRQTDRQRDNHR